MNDKRDPREALWLCGLARESTFTIRKNRQVFQVDIHSPTYGPLILCRPKSSPMTAKLVKQYESTLSNMRWLTIDPSTHPPPPNSTREVLGVACKQDDVYGMLCGVFGKENLCDDACSKWMKTYDPKLHMRIERSVNQYLHTAKRGMKKHEWIDEQCRERDITLGHVYAHLRIEGYTMHKHVKKCVRRCCMHWMNSPCTDHDTQCAVRIQRWYRHMYSHRVLHTARTALQGARNKQRMRKAMTEWRVVICAARTIQRTFRAHAAKCALRRMCCRWITKRFVRNVADYYSPRCQYHIVVCQRTCRRWLERCQTGRNEYVCI